MDSVIEIQRSHHEERERIIAAIVVENMEKKTSHREQVNSDHRIHALLERSIDAAKKLESIYEDEDGLRKEEVSRIGGPNEFKEFYDRLKQIKDFHRTRPEDVSKPLSYEFEQMNLAVKQNEDLPNMVEFSDEEGYGRFLDLHEHYQRYVNIKGFDHKCDYLDYLTHFDKLFEVAQEKKNTQYKEYISELMNYLYDYAAKVRPLIDWVTDTKETIEDFDKQWDAGQFPGWTDVNSAMKQNGAHLDLSPYQNAEELASLGLDRLKSALIALGLKCGGNLEARAERLFSTKGKTLAQIDKKLFNKKKKGKDKDQKKEIAVLEAQIYRLIEILGEQREMTRDNVERKQARTEDERIEDEDDEFIEEEEEGNEEDHDDIIYNPKNLPLGWDGKPIPYWLYKLHGLNIDYKCQICGNQTYRGPKAFQRHFSEWRHAHGMRCLGIPNTAHFANVTEIEDALALWAKLKEQKAHERFNPHIDEEFEDSEGNVVNRKTYDDMRRQGIL